MIGDPLKIKNKNIMKKINILILLFVCGIFGACSNEEYFADDETKTKVSPGTYYADLLLSAEGSDDVNMITRGGPDNNGHFTNEYPYDSIFIHSADNLSNDNGHKSLKINLKKVEYCDDCRGIHLSMTVLENNGGYIIENEEGEKINLNADEKVYFSTIDDTFWKAKVEGASPVSHSDVFIQGENNKELLRSVNEYDMNDLVALLQDGEPHIDMERHCTAFKTFIIFTQVQSDGQRLYDITIDEWNNLLGDGTDTYSPNHFYIKLYIGPNFTSEYNVYSDNVTKPEELGFYATNEQKYQPFSDAFYTNMGVSEGEYTPVAYNGYGYQTDADNYLIAPLNTNIDASEFSIYAFIKYAPDLSSVDENFLTSDEGAKYFRVQVPRFTLQTNTVHWIALAFDVRNLLAFKQSATAPTLTRTLGGPEKMEVKPLKIIHEKKPF